MATVTVKTNGGDYSSLDAVFNAIRTGAGVFSSNVPHDVILYTIGNEPASYTYTGSGVGSSRTQPVVFKVAAPSDNNGVPLDLKITKAGNFTNLTSIHWDTRNSGLSRLRFRGYWQLKGNCHNWQFFADDDIEGSGPGHLDGDVEWSLPSTHGGQTYQYKGNMFVQYGLVTRKINDDFRLEGVKFICRKKNETSGPRGWTVTPGTTAAVGGGVQCFKFDSQEGGGVSRPSDGLEVINCEFGHYGRDGLQILGVTNGRFSNVWIHDLYPREADNSDHIDGIHVLQAKDTTFDRFLIERVLYQGFWMKTDKTPNPYTGDATGEWNSLTNVTVSNVIAHTFGGKFLEGLPDFDGDLTYIDKGDTVPSLYKKTGGNAFGITNPRSVLFANCVGTNNFANAGLEVNFTASGDRPRLHAGGTWLNSVSDMKADIVNCVVSWAACDRSGGKLSIDPRAVGTWRNNLQTTVKTSSGSYEVVTVKGTGDLNIGTNPNWGADYVPFTGSPLINAGYTGALSTGLTLPTTDYNGTTWATRDIGAFETSGAVAAPLNANAGLDTAGDVSTAIPLDGGGSTSPGTTTYAWTKVSGPGTVTFSAASSSSTTATCSLVGTYVIRLTVSTTEAPGTTDTDDVSIVVSDPTSNEDTSVGHLLSNKVRLIGGAAFVGLKGV
jgi:hypothetical protein